MVAPSGELKEVTTGAQGSSLPPGVQGPSPPPGAQGASSQGVRAAPGVSTPEASPAPSPALQRQRVSGGANPKKRGIRGKAKAKVNSKAAAKVAAGSSSSSSNAVSAVGESSSSSGINFGVPDKPEFGNGFIQPSAYLVHGVENPILVGMVMQAVCLFDIVLVVDF